MKRKNNRGIGISMFIIAALVIGGLSLSVADTELWKYKDSKGIYHYVDELYKVPEKYRKRAVKIEIKSTAVQPTPKHTPSKPKITPQQIETEKAKEKWRKKAKNAVARVETLEKSLKSMDGDCATLQIQWERHPNIANRQEFEKCAQSLQRTKVELEKARHYSKTGMYKEAQSAGVPIQWFDYILENYQ